jgi:pimeloyl-ACP methyl ester carboxylesterase
VGGRLALLLAASYPEQVSAVVTLGPHPTTLRGEDSPWGASPEECGLLDGDVAGIAVHVAARVLAQAGDGEILCSRTVKDLVAGAGFAFADRGTRRLKGVPDEWQLYDVDLAER